MATLNVKNFPESLLRVVKTAASLEGKTLRDYVVIALAKSTVVSIRRSVARMDELQELGSLIGEDVLEGLRDPVIRVARRQASQDELQELDEHPERDARRLLESIPPERKARLIEALLAMLREQKGQQQEEGQAE